LQDELMLELMVMDADNKVATIHQQFDRILSQFTCTPVHPPSSHPPSSRATQLTRHTTRHDTTRHACPAAPPQSSLTSSPALPLPSHPASLTESSPAGLPTRSSSAAIPRSYSGSTLASSGATTPNGRKRRQANGEGGTASDEAEAEYDNGDHDKDGGKDNAFTLLLNTEKFIHHLEGAAPASPSTRRPSRPFGLDAHALSDYKGEGSGDALQPPPSVGGESDPVISPRGGDKVVPHAQTCLSDDLAFRSTDWSTCRSLRTWCAPSTRTPRRHPPRLCRK
jgi:hypothetical protein